jgi:hypothetical protein
MGTSPRKCKITEIVGRIPLNVRTSSEPSIVELRSVSQDDSRLSFPQIGELQSGHLSIEHAFFRDLINFPCV